MFVFSDSGQLELKRVLVFPDSGKLELDKMFVSSDSGQLKLHKVLVFSASGQLDLIIEAEFFDHRNASSRAGNSKSENSMVGNSKRETRHLPISIFRSYSALCVYGVFHRQ